MYFIEFVFREPLPVMVAAFSMIHHKILKKSLQFQKN